MRVFKTRSFARWANTEALNDRALATAVVEMEQGSIDARLGGHVVKKRIALPGRGKRSGARTLLAIELLSYSAAMLTKAVGAGELIEIEGNDDG